MARRCAICGKGSTRGHRVSHSNVHTKRTWHPNLQKLRVWVDNKPRRVYVCTACLRAGKVRRAL